MTVEGAGLRAWDAGRAAGGLPCAWAERDQNTELKPGGQSQLPKELKGNPDRKSDPYAPLSVRKAKQSNSVNRPPHPQHTHTEEKGKTLDLALRGCFFWALVKLSFWQDSSSTIHMSGKAVDDSRWVRHLSSSRSGRPSRPVCRSRGTLV